MSKKTFTTLRPRFCISVNHPAGYLDENAIKAVLEAGQLAMANELLCLSCVVVADGPDPANPEKDEDLDGCDTVPDSVAVKVVGLDIGRKAVNLRTFGTEDVPLKTWVQTDYIE